MLPSMPILFTNSQDAFGSKPEPSTSYFHKGLFQKPPETLAPPPVKIVEEPVKIVAKETKVKPGGKKKEQNKAAPSKAKANSLETALVTSYYTKVQSKFSSNLNVPANKFVQFQNALKSFNPTKETPVNLYKKIEQIFGEASDVAEEFLLFLKPEQAAKAGRFMDYFMLVQLTGFIDALQVAFARKPTVHRKILRALTNSINTGNSEQIKSRVIPHLRSNTKLAQAFRSLFPDERPPDSCYEVGAEILNESFLTSDRGCDEWELEGATDDRRNIQPKETLDTMYQHGRVYLQHGRMLRSARVVYPYSKEPYRVHARRLAPDLCQLSPPDSDEEPSAKRTKATPKIPAKRARKQTKSPTKATKDVNDNTSKSVNTIKSSKRTKKVNTKKEETTKTKKEKALAKNQEAKSKVKLDAIGTVDKNDAKDSIAKKSENVITAIKETKTKTVTFNLNTSTKDANRSQTQNTNKKNNEDQNTEKKTPENTSSTEKKTRVNTSTDKKTPVNTSTVIPHMSTDKKNHENQSNEKKNPVTKCADKKWPDTRTDGKNTENLCITKKNNKNSSTDMKSWTRDEDKTMLQVLKGEAGSEQIFRKIKDLLPHRSSTEIEERFCHVMNLLQQMAVGEVT